LKSFEFGGGEGWLKNEIKNINKLLKKIVEKIKIKLLEIFFKKLKKK
jgi:hypothetical protein